MGEHGERHEQRRTVRPAEPADDAVGDIRADRPEHSRDEAVGIGHVVQIERVRGGDAGDDAGLLEAQQHERAPEHVKQLDGKEQRPERDGLIAALRGEAHTVVADEHYSPISSFHVSIARCANGHLSVPVGISFPEPQLRRSTPAAPAMACRPHRQ